MSKRSSSPGTDGDHVVTSNRRARRDYEIFDIFEAGLVLVGSEVRSLREGSVHLKDAYASIDQGEAYLINCYIGPYAPAGKRQQHDPERRRKLLLHRYEIDRLYGKTAERGLALIPLRIYFRDGHAKVELAVARGRRTHDKRELKRRQAVEKEIKQALHRRR